MKKAGLLAALLAAASLGAQEEPKLLKNYPSDGVYWSASWLAAADEAEARNAMIYVVFHKDDSDACATMANTVYRDRKFIEASRKWVNLVAHEGKKHDADAMIGGKRIPRCERYWGIECKDHDYVYGAVKVKMDIDRIAPNRVYLKPNCEELTRDTGASSTADLVKRMDALALNQPGEKIDADEYRKFLALAAEGDKAFKEENWQAAIKAFTAVSKMPKERLKKKGEDGLRRVTVVGSTMVSEADGLIQKARAAGSKDFTEAKKKLRKIIQDFKGLPPAKAAQQRLDGLS